MKFYYVREALMAIGGFVVGLTDSTGAYAVIVNSLLPGLALALIGSVVAFGVLVLTVCAGG